MRKGSAFMALSGVSTKPLPPAKWAYKGTLACVCGVCACAYVRRRTVFLLFVCAEKNRDATVLAAHGVILKFARRLARNERISSCRAFHWAKSKHWIILTLLSNIAKNSKYKHE